MGKWTAQVQARARQLSSQMELRQTPSFMNRWYGEGIVLENLTLFRDGSDVYELGGIWHHTVKMCFMV